MRPESAKTGPINLALAFSARISDDLRGIQRVPRTFRAETDSKKAIQRPSALFDVLSMAGNIR